MATKRSFPLFFRFVLEQFRAGRITLHPGYLFLLIQTLRSVRKDMVRMAHLGSIARDGNRGHGLRVKVGACSLHADSFSDLQTMREVFYDRVYDTPVEAGSVVLDVGMHVGYASLYFASQEEVRQVYAFEPCGPTLEAARKQLAENVGLAAKIEAFGFGLSDEDREVEWDYSFQWKGSVGRYGLSRAMLQSPDTVTLRVTLCRASLISELLDRHPGAPVLLKLDCEGSEGPILETLEQEGLLQKISTICLEWHEGEVQPLMDILRRGGFKIVSHSDLSSRNNGLLVARRIGDSVV